MSGIYIPGMEMPQRGQMILVYPDGNAALFARADIDIHDFAFKNVRAFHVQDHGRLIDADAICAVCRNWVEENDGIYPDCSYCLAHDAPTIIQADKDGDT